MKWVYAEDWPSEGPPPWGMGEGPGDEEAAPAGLPGAVAD
jgi:hypothetical protein